MLTTKVLVNYPSTYNFPSFSSFIINSDYQEDVEPVDLTVTHLGRLWDHEAEECRELLRSMSELSAAMHNVKGKTNDAIRVSTSSLFYFSMIV